MLPPPCITLRKVFILNVALCMLWWKSSFLVSSSQRAVFLVCWGPLKLQLDFWFCFSPFSLWWLFSMISLFSRNKSIYINLTWDYDLMHSLLILPSHLLKEPCESPTQGIGGNMESRKAHTSSLSQKCPPASTLNGRYNPRNISEPVLVTWWISSWRSTCQMPHLLSADEQWMYSELHPVYQKSSFYRGELRCTVESTSYTVRVDSWPVGELRASPLLYVTWDQTSCSIVHSVNQ